MLRKICIIILSVFTALCMLVTLLGTGFMVADGLCEETARYVPTCEKADLTPLLEKETLSDEDYALLYAQTGLSRLGVDSVLRSQLPAFQDAFFYEGKIEHDYTTPVTLHEYLTDPDTGETVYAPIVPLQEGDVLLSSTSHLFGWRHGHAALVTDPDTYTVLQSINIGIDSDVDFGGAGFFLEASNFLVLRLKGAAREERARIAERAENELTGIPYVLSVGVFSPKDQCKNGRKPKQTHCAHLVWQAYKNCGYDIDCNGGPVCTPRDIARSPLFEVVQVYGFDPQKLW